MLWKTLISESGKAFKTRGADDDYGPIRRLKNKRVEICSGYLDLLVGILEGRRIGVADKALPVPLSRPTRGHRQFVGAERIDLLSREENYVSAELYIYRAYCSIVSFC